MPRWSNPPLLVYHGTDTIAVPRAAGLPIGRSVPFRIQVGLCRPFTDFGQGFYVTTHLHQARQWANAKVIRTPNPSSQVLVLGFFLDRDWLASLEALTFVRPIQDFWNLVYDCRNMFPPHQRVLPATAAYDTVYGPVTLWPSILTIQDCDQISLHNQTKIDDHQLADPIIIDKALTDTFPV